MIGWEIKGKFEEIKGEKVGKIIGRNREVREEVVG